MMLKPIRVAFLHPTAACTCGRTDGSHASQCAKQTGLDLFGDARTIQDRFSRQVHARAVEQALDIYESHVRDKRVIYYDTRPISPPIILHDRAALLQAFTRDGQIGRPA